MINKVFAIYFLTHIPTTLLMGAQLLFGQYYPKPLTDAKDNWSRDYGDKLLSNPPVWFKSFVASEVFLQVPFFLFAFLAMWRVNTQRRIFLSSTMAKLMLIYGAHVCTTMIAIGSTIFFDPMYRPDHTWQLAVVGSVYGIYFVIPLLVVIYTWNVMNIRSSSGGGEYKSD